MNGDDPLDLKALRIDPRDLGLVQKGDARLVPSVARAARARRQFIKVPQLWLDRFKGINNAATLKVALRLLQLHFRDHGRPAQLGNLGLKTAGVSRMQKHRALVELEGLGLVHVERRPHTSPIVTVILEPE
jgi:hypothetical protein